MTTICRQSVDICMRSISVYTSRILCTLPPEAIAYSEWFERISEYSSIRAVSVSLPGYSVSWHYQSCVLDDFTDSDSL